MTTEKGQAAILIVFVLGMVSILIGLSLTQTGFMESVMGRTEVGSAQAFYAAQSGVEEAFYQIGRDSSYGVSEPGTFELEVEEGLAQVKVYGTEDQKTIESVGIYEPYVRKLKVETQNTSLKPGFDHAIHAGLGGLELRNNTIVTGKDDSPGNIFSNNFVKGAKNDFSLKDDKCKTSASAVEGSVWAVEKIDKLAENDSGVCIMEEAYSGSLDYCFVKGVPNSPATPSVNCFSLSQWTENPAPEPIALPDMGIDNLKNYLLGRGKVFSGDCILDGSGGSSDCSGGTNIIGNMIITGNLRKPSNVNIKISGPVWVQKNVIFDSLGSVGLTADITEVSQIMVADGTILSDSNVTFGSNQNAFLLFISTYASESTPPPEPESAEFCESPAIKLSSNTNSVLFYASNGCIMVTANSTFHGAILGEKILVDNNSTVEYDPALQSAIFGLTKSGGWQIISFKEE